MSDIHIVCESLIAFQFLLKLEFVFFGSLFSVNKSFPNVALTPLDQDKEVRGYHVELFSPYYPCYTAAGDYTLTCKVTVKK